MIIHHYSNCGDEKRGTRIRGVEERMKMTEKSGKNEIKSKIKKRRYTYIIQILNSGRHRKNKRKKLQAKRQCKAS